MPCCYKGTSLVWQSMIVRLLSGTLQALSSLTRGLVYILFISAWRVIYNDIYDILDIFEMTNSQDGTLLHRKVYQADVDVTDKEHNGYVYYTRQQQHDDYFDYHTTK